MFFDVVGGGSPIVQPVFESLPDNGKLVVVANLTKKPIPLDTSDLLHHNKSIGSFLCFRWLEQISPERRTAAYQEVADDLSKNEGRIFGTNFTKTVPLISWEEALQSHAQVASSEHGKILLSC